MDRISNLPDDILSSLLSFLNIRDAAKTRVLSSKWRHLSALAPNLHFDISTLFGLEDANYHREDAVNELRFVERVDQYLDLCTSPNPYSFKVHYYSLNHKFASNIDRWISLALRLQVKQLELNFSFCTYQRLRRQLYNFPHQPFSQPQLVHLCLGSCTLSQTTFDYVLSGCVNLKFLRLQECELPMSLNICSQLHMKHLQVSNCEGVQKIDLSVVLTTFDYRGWDIDPVKIRFVGHSLVEKVSLYQDQASSLYAFSGLADDLPQLQLLSLIINTSRTSKIPIFTSAFCQMKELQLDLLLYSHFDLLSVVCILNACPRLEKFHLALKHFVEKCPLESKQISKQFYYNLKEVEINGFRDRCHALDLATYLMDHAVGLQRMIIDYKRTFLSEPYWDDNEIKNVQNKLSRKKGKVELLVRNR